MRRAIALGWRVENGQRELGQGRRRALKAGVKALAARPPEQVSVSEALNPTPAGESVQSRVGYEEHHSPGRHDTLLPRLNGCKNAR